VRVAQAQGNFGRLAHVTNAPDVDQRTSTTPPAATSQTTISEQLDQVPGLIVWHERRFARAGSVQLLDHLISSRAGAFLLQEMRSAGSFSVEDGGLVRHRSGPSGQWAKGHEHATVDQVRRTAELVESAVGKPVEPVLVLPRTSAAFTEVVTIRGVLVLPAETLLPWLSGLRVSVDRAEVVLVAARIERAFPAADAVHRVPDWQVHNAPASRPRRPGRGPVPLRNQPGPRDYSLPVLIEPLNRATCAPPPRRRGRISRLLAIVSGVAVLLSVAVSTGALGQLKDHLGSSTGPPAQESGWSPPAPRIVSLKSCSVVSAAQVSKALGVRVELLPASTATSCDFGPSSSRPQDVLASIRLGLDDKAKRASQLGSSMQGWTYPKDAPAPDRSGRRMGAALTVAIVTEGWRPSRSTDQLEAMAISIGTQLVRSS
jgi:hypothetical protein